MELPALVDQLNSLQDLDLTVARLIARGRAAVPLLERFLMQGKPSVVYQPRRAAVEVLGALGAMDVLVRYLTVQKDIADPATRSAEQAVEDAAALEAAAASSRAVIKRSECFR